MAGYTALYTVLGDTRLHRRSRSEESMERLIQTVSREEDRLLTTGSLKDFGCYSNHLTHCHPFVINFVNKRRNLFSLNIAETGEISLTTLTAHLHKSFVQCAPFHAHIFIDNCYSIGGRKNPPGDLREKVSTVSRSICEF